MAILFGYIRSQAEDAEVVFGLDHSSQLAEHLAAMEAQGGEPNIRAFPVEPARAFCLPKAGS